jgi:peptide/nickel transport system ATP-binding protein
MAMPLLEVKHLGVAFGEAEAIADVTFALAPGERLAIVGRAGAGKSCLAGVLAGLPPAGARVAGAIRLGGEGYPGREADLAAFRARHLGYLPGSADSLFDPLRTIGEHIGLVSGAAGGFEALREAGLPPSVGYRFADTLSPSERMRVALAIALARSPLLLVCDDPGQSLDSVDRRHLLETILAAARSRPELAMVFLTRELRQGAVLATTLAVLEAGAIVETGLPQDVLARPQHPVTTGLVRNLRPQQKSHARQDIGDEVLALEDVTRYARLPWLPLPDRRRTLLSRVSLRVRRGEGVGVIGRAGAGKTVLLRVVAGLVRPDAGRIEVDRVPYGASEALSAIRPPLGLVGARPREALNPELPIGSSLAEPLRPEQQLIVEEQAGHLVEAVRAVGLAPDVLNRYPRDFDDATLLRLCIARAVITRPRLLLLDDPLAGLEESDRVETLAMLSRLRAEYALALLFASREIDHVLHLSDRLLVLNAGRIVESGATVEILQSPGHETTRALLRARFALAG